MEQYDALHEPDPFSCSGSAFERLVSALAGGPAAALAHDELEVLLEQQGRELLRQLLQDHLDLRARREEDAVRAGEAGLVRGPDGRPRTWREPGHCRWLAGLLGVVRVSRVAHRGPGLSNVHPADAALSLPAGRHSLGVRRLAVLEAVRGSFDQVGAAIERRCGKVVGKRRLATLVVEAATDIAAFYAAKIPVVHPGHAAGDPGRWQWGGDASRSVTRGHPQSGGEERGGRAAGPARPGRETQPETDGDRGLHLRHRSRTPSAARHRSSARGPQRCPPAPAGAEGPAEVCTALVIRPPEQVIADAFTQAQARDPEHLREWIVLVDGARHQLDVIHAEAARRSADIHVLLDFVHVAEYTWAAAHAFHPPGSQEAEAWAADKLTTILAGRAERAATEMTAQASANRLPAARRDAVAACHRYLTGHLDQLHYDTALTAGWPIATGAVEGACRLIADRLDITGARWGLNGAEAVLQLRALITNGDFDTYWPFHAAREHQRLYPTADQREYHLTA